jgi:spore coat protein U-like protein
MQKLIMTAASVALLAAMSGAGEAADVAITLSANVASSCQVAAGSSGPLLSTLDFTKTFEVKQDGTLNLIPQDVSFVVACNAGATATLTSLKGGLLNPTQPAQDQVNVIDYEAQVAGAITTGIGKTATNPQTGSVETLASSTGTFSGTATVTITPVAIPLGKRLAVGSYTDTLTLKILPSS